MRQLVRNAGDREQVHRADRHVKQKRRQELNDVATILASPVGRRYIFRLISRLRPVEPLFNEPAVQSYLVARHDVAVELLNEIHEASPDAWVHMQQEAREREKIEDAANAPPELTEEEPTPTEG